MARQNGKTRAKEAVSRAAERGEQAARTLDETSAQLRDGVEAGSRQFAELSGQAFDAWMRSSSDALERVLEVNVELAAWSREQLDDGLDAMRSLTQCRSVGDAYGIQMGLMRSSMEKSLRHASNVVHLVTHAVLAGAQASSRFQRPG